MAELSTWPFKYELLDGTRGLAALLVVMHHVGIVPLGHFAVMFFFVISGYCIAASAESCRRKGMAFSVFMLRRFRRIYPPYLFAIAFFAVTRVIKAAAGGHNDLLRPWTDWVQNLTLTQWVTLPFHPVADAAQNHTLLVTAFWSLNYEEQFYLVMALALLLALKRGVPVHATVLFLGAAGLIWNCTVPDGWITGIFLEYWADFAIGAALFYALCSAPSRAIRYLFPGVVGLIGVCCASQVTSWGLDADAHPRAFVELATTAGFGLLLFVARPLSPWLIRHYWWRPISGLGAISYSLYLVHQFNLTLVTTTARHMIPDRWPHLQTLTVLVLHITIAAAFWFAFERPFSSPSTGSQRRALMVTT